MNPLVSLFDAFLNAGVPLNIAIAMIAAIGAALGLVIGFAIGKVR